MKIGNTEIALAINEAIIGSVVAITFTLLFFEVPQSSIDLFKQGFGALIAWGAGYAMGKKEST